MIEKRLLELPDEISKTRIKLLDMDQWLGKEREKMENWIVEQTINITNAKDEKGKAVYSNETKRKSELAYRKQTSTTYKTLESNYRKLEREIEIKKIELDKLYNEQKNLRAICRLEGGLDGDRKST